MTELEAVYELTTETTMLAEVRSRTYSVSNLTQIANGNTRNITKGRE